jgi:membrane associated rhomboid family serine protease
MFLIVPYHVDVPMRRRPWMNWVLIGITIIVYPFCVFGRGFTPLGEALTLGGTSWVGFVGHVLVHAGILHLLGNMLFLWVFGNAVCSKVGNLAYPFIYFGLGTVAGLASYVIDPRPAVGASGAINGVVGMFVVWYLLNEVSCWYGYWFFGAANAGTFQVSSFWMILLWIAFDVLGLIWSGGNIGYVAHVAGFAAGFGLAVLLLSVGLVKMDTGERSLLQLISGTEENGSTPRRDSRRGRDAVHYKVGRKGRR